MNPGEHLLKPSVLSTVMSQLEPRCCDRKDNPLSMLRRTAPIQLELVCVEDLDARLYQDHNSTTTVCPVLLSTGQLGRQAEWLLTGLVKNQTGGC